MLKIIQWAIGVFACILLANLVWTVVSLDHSLMYLISATADNNASETIRDFKDSWAIRGQMGDILSGHFSALAFLAVAFSILLQNEANRKMQTSIEKQDKALEQQEKSLQQQSKALEVQSKSLEAQLEELQQSRKESEKQTQEFYINNLNSKLNRYYEQIHKKVDGINIKSFSKYAEAYKKGFQNLSESEASNVDTCEIQYYQLFDILETAYKDLQDIQSYNENIYEKFLKEFVTNISSIQMIIALKGFYRDAFSFSVAKLIDAKAFHKVLDRFEKQEQL